MTGCRTAIFLLLLIPTSLHAQMLGAEMRYNVDKDQTLEVELVHYYPCGFGAVPPFEYVSLFETMAIIERCDLLICCDTGIAKAAMEENMADADHAPSEHLMRLYQAWADPPTNAGPASNAP